MQCMMHVCLLCAQFLVFDTRDREIELNPLFAAHLSLSLVTLLRIPAFTAAGSEQQSVRL